MERAEEKEYQSSVAVVRVVSHYVMQNEKCDHLMSIVYIVMYVVSKSNTCIKSTWSALVFCCRTYETQNVQGHSPDPHFEHMSIVWI